MSLINIDEDKEENIFNMSMNAKSLSLSDINLTYPSINEIPTKN